MFCKILRCEEKDKFCKDLGINNDVTGILLKIENNTAKYFDGMNYYSIQIKIARKYI